MEQKKKHLPGWVGILLWSLAAIALGVACYFLLGVATQEDGSSYPVRINEILGANSRYPNSDGLCCDYIELYNVADYPVDISGFRLGPLDGGSRYAFPQGTVLEGKSYLLIWCDPTGEKPGYAPFGISRGGDEAFYLIATNGAIADSVVTGAMDVDQAMALDENRAWQLTTAVTPGRSNAASGQPGQEVYNPQLSALRISEICTVNTGLHQESGQLLDWVELWNMGTETADLSGFILTDNPGNEKYVFPVGTSLEPQERLLVLCGPEGEAPFALGKEGGETVLLKNQQGAIIQVVDTLPMPFGSSMALDAQGNWAVTAEATPGYPNTPQGYEDCTRALGTAPGMVVISEFMAAAQTVIPDENGDFQDWAELYNASQTPVELTGWFLSDDATDPAKWQIPKLVLQPGEYTVIFLSGKDTPSQDRLHASFSLSAGGESLILSSPMGVPVSSVTFGASQAGCSFVRNDDGTYSENRFPTPGYPNEDPEAFWEAAVPKGPLAIWEVMTYNEKYLAQPTGECYDWVELKNISAETISLADYALTDDPGTKDQFILPNKELKPGETFIVILSGNSEWSNYSYTHGNFALNAQEDSLYLYRTDGALEDFVFLRDIPVGCSYGREEGTGGFFYMEPTPKKANQSGSRSISPEPTSTYAPGVYTGDQGFTVPLSAPGTIHYTLDGSEPDTDSPVYAQPISITQTCVLRAVTAREGELLSDIYTATFVIGDHHDLPVVSLVTDPSYLWGPYGIYKNGDLSVKYKVRPANVSYTGEDGRFSMDCRMNLHGATTVTLFDKKTFAVRFLDAYDGILNYDVFGDGEVTQFKSLIIRTAHEGTYSTQMRDALMGTLAAEGSETMLSQKYKYVALYLNGEYWGLYALRERHSPEHYSAYTGVPADTVHTVRFCNDEINSLSAFYKYLGAHSLESDEAYAYACSVLNMESFADWIIYEAYTGDGDIYENVRYYYSSQEDCWRMGLADMDLGMYQKTAFDELATTFHHGRVVQRLYENREFRDLLARRLAVLLEGPLSDEHVLQTLDGMADTIREEIVLDAARWKYPVSGWEYERNYLRNFCDGRARQMIDNFCSELGLTSQEREAYFGHLLD